MPSTEFLGRARGLYLLVMLHLSTAAGVAATSLGKTLPNKLSNLRTKGQLAVTSTWTQVPAQGRPVQRVFPRHDQVQSCWSRRVGLGISSCTDAGLEQSEGHRRCDSMMCCLCKELVSLGHSDLEGIIWLGLFSERSATPWFRSEGVKRRTAL